MRKKEPLHMVLHISVCLKPVRYQSWKHVVIMESIHHGIISINLCNVTIFMFVKVALTFSWDHALKISHQKIFSRQSRRFSSWLISGPCGCQSMCEKDPSSSMNFFIFEHHHSGIVIFEYAMPSRKKKLLIGVATSRLNQLKIFVWSLFFSFNYLLI